MASLIQQAQKRVELPQPQFIDEVVDDSVMVQKTSSRSPSVQSNSRGVSVSVQQQSGGSQWCNREQVPQVQFRAVTQREIPVQRVQKKIGFCSCCAGSQVHIMEETADSPQLLIVQQHVEAPEIQTSESLKSTHVRQVAC